MSDRDTQGVDVQMLLDRIAALEAQLAPKPSTDLKMLDINDVRVPYVFRPFPATVYKRSAKKGQIDHPGNISKIVKDERQLEAALEAGWSKEPFPAPDPDEVPAAAEPAPAEPARAPKRAKVGKGSEQ